MKRKFLISILLAGACVAGIACGRLVYRSSAFRDATGICCGGGHLLAIAKGVGIYEVEAVRNPQNYALPAGGFARNLIAREFPLRSA